MEIIGDQLLRESDDPILKHRRLSVSDAATIVLAENIIMSIVTGDADLSFARKDLE